MTKTEIIKRVRALELKLRAEGVVHLALFGSRARGDNRVNSDLDILIDVRPNVTFSILNLVGIEQLISDETGLSANAFMRRSLDAEFQRTALRDAVRVF